MLNFSILFLSFIFCGIVANPICPPGTTPLDNSNNCLLFGVVPKSFNDAEAACVVEGGHLIPIFDQITNLKIDLQANEKFKDSTDFWIGGYAKNINSALIWVWKWQNILMTYTDWASGQPSNNNGCTSVSLSTASWSSADCNLLKPYVCQIPAIGYFCEDGWTFLDETKMCYKMFANQTLNSTAADDVCRNQNANLVSIHSDAENTLVGKLTTLGSPQNWPVIGVWTGLIYNKTWTWTDGTPFDYQAWGALDPDNNGKVSCALFFPDGLTSSECGDYIMQWDSADCSDIVQRTVCKKKAFAVPMFSYV